MKQISKHLFAMFGVLLASFTFAQDMPGSKDHPIAKRFAGSVIVGYDVKNFEAVEFQTSTFLRYDTTARKRIFAQPPLALEGKLTRIWYEAAGDVSPTEIFRNYTDDLSASGFTTLYDSTKDANVKAWNGFLIPFGSSGSDGAKTSRSEYVFYSASASSARVATLQKGNTSVRLIAIGWNADDRVFKSKRGAYIAVDILESKAMEQNMVVVSASEMSKSIASTGKVAIYGIFFDTNKAEVKAESKPSLEQIAAYLKNEPNTRLHVVGHTDNVGGFDGNMGLSKRRADAVVAALSRDYGIAGNRLTANGVAYLAPVSTNSSEDGRAKNRRVELVLQ